MHLCSASAEYRQSLWLPSVEPAWGELSWAGNGTEVRRESSYPAPISCVGWQGWPAQETKSAPQNKWGQSHSPEILDQSKLSSALVQWSRTLCIFFLAEITPITHLIYSPLFLILIKTTFILFMKPQMLAQGLGKGKHQHNNNDNEMKSSSVRTILHQCFDQNVQFKKCY